MQKHFITYLAILIFFQSSLGTINLLFEIGEMVEDYQLHLDKYGDNFSTFLSKHFGDLKESHKEQHEEEHRHHNHPQTDFGHTTQSLYVLQSIDFEINNTVENITTINNFGYKNLHSTFEMQKIFQPPQLT